MKKQILLTALTLTLLASAVMTAAAEEVVGTILFEPKFWSEVNAWDYSLDTDGDGIGDRTMTLRPVRNGVYLPRELSRYLNKDWKIVFEDNGLKPFEDFDAGRMLLLISPEGRQIELTQMFSRDTIRQSLPYLNQKLDREGR